jgi:hypothetical protein
MVAILRTEIDALNPQRARNIARPHQKLLVELRFRLLDKPLINCRAIEARAFNATWFGLKMAIVILRNCQDKSDWSIWLSDQRCQFSGGDV